MCWTNQGKYRRNACPWQYLGVYTSYHRFDAHAVAPSLWNMRENSLLELRRHGSVSLGAHTLSKLSLSSYTTT